MTLDEFLCEIRQQRARELNILRSEYAKLFEQWNGVKWSRELEELLNEPPPKRCKECNRILDLCQQEDSDAKFCCQRCANTYNMRERLRAIQSRKAGLPVSRERTDKHDVPRVCDAEPINTTDQLDGSSYVE